MKKRKSNMLIPTSAWLRDQGLITNEEYKILFNAEFDAGVNPLEGMKCPDCQKNYSRIIDIEFIYYVGSCSRCDHYKADALQSMNETIEEEIPITHTVKK